jgi:hypothetical protein
MTMVSDKGMGSTAIWGSPVQARAQDTRMPPPDVTRNPL